jgi:AcrR family transcriptional regulator
MPKVSQEHRDARRRTILDAARAVFADKGFAQASTTDIVQATGLSTGAVYSYFPSKQDLVLAVADDAVATLAEAFDASDVAGLLSQLRALSADRGHARLMAQVWAEAAVSPELAARVRDRNAVLTATLADGIRTFRRSAGAPAHPSPEGLADAILAALTGFSLRLAIGQDTDDRSLEQALRAITLAGEP